MRNHPKRPYCLPTAAALGAVMMVAALPPARAAQASGCVFNDAHFHLTNYVQQGTDASLLLS